MLKNRFKVIPAVYLILTKESKVLLMRRFNTGYEDGNYGLPSGHKESGENPSEALIREVKEEIGINVDTKSKHHVHTMARIKGVDSERIDMFFHITNWKGEIINCEPHKCDHMEWFDINNLPPNTIPYIREVLNHWKNEVFYSEGTS